MFEPKYLTFNEYRQLGGKMEESSYQLLEFEIEKEINKRTQNRLAKLKDYPFDLKICVLKMVDVFEQYKSLEQQNKAVTSEGIDGYSISYRKLEKDDIDAKNTELEKIMRRYLSEIMVDGEQILFLGVNKNVS